jgi:hypothetical protein
MRKLRSRMKRLSLLAVCSFGMLWPTVSFASLNSIVCSAIYRSCKQGCTTAQCVEDCQYASINCQLAGTKKKQQTSPLAKPGRPVKPVGPVNVSNPNQPTGPVILRQNDSGGHEHGYRH